MKKIALALVGLLIVAALGLTFWVRSALATETVRTTLAAQLSKSLGQPVQVQGVSATVYPRVTVTLTGVTIGSGSPITVQSIDVGTALGALFSRRIEHAALHVNGAKLQLPLPTLAFGSTDASASGPSPVTLVSIDEVVLTDIQVVSRGRTVRGDIDVVPHGDGLTIRKIALTADNARIDATGELTSLAGPVGTLDLKAGALDLDQLLAFATDFSAGSGVAPASGASSSGAATAPSTPSTKAADLTVTLAADKASMAGLTLDRIAGKAHLQGEQVRLEPLTFGIFGGTYSGSLGASLGAEPVFDWKAALKDVDMAAVASFVGSPGIITGKLAGDIDLSGTGLDAAAAMKSARGRANLLVSNGTVKNLALVRSAVAATSLDPQAAVQAAQEQRDEPFTELGGSLSIFAGTASTPDLHFISKDVRLDAGGALKLDGSALTLQGLVSLSEELTKQANATLARFTERDGRISMPITVRGSVDKYSIQIDSASVAKQALKNEAKAQAGAAVKKGIGRLLGR